MRVEQGFLFKLRLRLRFGLGSSALSDNYDSQAVTVNRTLSFKLRMVHAESRRGQWHRPGPGLPVSSTVNFELAAGTDSEAPRGPPSRVRLSECQKSSWKSGVRLPPIYYPRHRNHNPVVIEFRIANPVVIEHIIHRNPAITDFKFGLRTAAYAESTIIRVIKIQSVTNRYSGGLGCRAVGLRVTAIRRVYESALQWPQHATRLRCTA